MRLLLDTTALVQAMRARPETLSLLNDAVLQGHQLTISAINLAEAYAGMRRGEEALTQRFLESMFCFPISLSIAERAGRLKNDWVRKGKTFGLADMIVAATALEYNLSLITDNRKGFAIPAISFYPSP